MLRVTVELVPWGIESQKHTIAQMDIVNDGSSKDRKIGNYYFKVFGKGNRKMGGGEVKDYKREAKHVWYLILLCLKNRFEK